MADPNTGNIQLLPATRKEIKIKRHRSFKDFLIPGIAVGIVLAIYGGLFYYKSSLISQITTIDQEILQVERSRDKTLEKEILALEKQLSTVGPILNNHIYWSKGIEKIESLLKPEIEIESFSAEEDSITFNARALNYLTVAKQIAVMFSDDTITNVTIGGLSLDQGDRVAFSMVLEFDKNKLLKQ